MIDNAYFFIMGILDGPKRLKGLTIVPYILLYLTFWLFITPFRKLKVNKLSFEEIGIPRYKLIKLAKLCCIIQIIYILIKLYQVYLVSQIGFGNFKDLQGENSGIDAQLFYGGALGGLVKLFNYAGRLINLVFMPTLVIYSAYLYNRKQMSQKLFLWITLTYGIGLLLRGMVGGSRAIMFFSVMEMCFYYFLFSRYLNKKLKAKIIKWALLLLSCIIVITASITVERNEGIGGGRVSPIMNTLRYLGEMWPNLGLEYWNRVNIHPYGELLFSSFGNSNDDIGVDWFYKTGAHTWWFFTILGRLYFEYGKLIAICIILLIALYIHKFFDKRKFQLCDMGLVVFIYNFCVASLFTFSLDNPITIFGLIMIILFSKALKTKKTWKI